MRKSIIKTAVTFCITAVILFAVNRGMSGLEATNERDYLNKILPYLLPGGSVFTEEEAGDEEAVLKAYRGENGYVIHTVTQGYVDELELLVGVDDTGMVRGICVYGQHETFGLGSFSRYNVNFLKQYLGTTGEAETGSTVDALSGATVSSKAVTRGVNAAIAYVTGADISSGATTWGG